jgi:hypothetical protein
MQRVEPHLANLSSVVFVATRDDAVRREVASRIEHHGVACLVVVVDEARRKAIERGEALWL